MKKSYLMIGLGLLGTVSLVGCGGGGGSSTTATTGTTPTFIGDGIYKNSGELVVMVVDSTRSKNNLVVGDFEDDAVLFVRSATTTKDQMKTKGMLYADSGSIVDTDTQTMTANFNDKTVTLTTVINNQNFIFSMDKAGDSLPLDQIVGTHTNPDDGSTWAINADGSFTVNGICTITGNLKRRGAYFNIDKATAVSCNDVGLNGDYHGMLLTVSHEGKEYIAGLLGNDSSLLWGSAVKAN